MVTKASLSLLAQMFKASLMKLFSEQELRITAGKKNARQWEMDEGCAVLLWAIFYNTKINLFYQGLRRGKVRTRTYFFVGIYVFLAALLLWTHQCQLIDPDLACWLSPLDKKKKKMLLNYIGSHDKIYSAVSIVAILPWLLWLHYDCMIFSLFISFVFLYYCSFNHGILVFHLHAAQILTDEKVRVVNCWCLWN